MSDLEEQIKQLRNVIFNMLNFTNIYTLILDESMIVKFANNSLAKDLGFDTYKDILGCYWLEFIKDEEKEIVKEIHGLISKGVKWEEFRECKNEIIGINKKVNSVYWFNSHINSEYNWTFSFGIKRSPLCNVTIDAVRNYYQEIINKDRIMINSMKNVIKLKEKNTMENINAEPSFI